MAFNGKTSLILNQECFSRGVCMAEREGFEPSMDALLVGSVEAMCH
jgi:hypothetical protein